MKKLILGILIGLLLISNAWAADLNVSTTITGSVDKVGDADRPGLLFKFDLPAALQDARIDMAYLRFQVQADTSREALGLLVRPMLVPWTNGVRLSNLSESAASPLHINFGRIGSKSGLGQVRITRIVRAWQQGELPNFGILVYPENASMSSLQLRTLASGGLAELEIFFTGPEKK
ncbi:MAG: hypothetical protein L0196_07395 [candidate division Zixibacteria bacterium]|nr:hypothetical protein [candidate division Zixibacteria bacterium]